MATGGDATRRPRRVFRRRDRTGIARLSGAAKPAVPNPLATATRCVTDRWPMAVAWLLAIRLATWRWVANGHHWLANRWARQMAKTGGGRRGEPVSWASRAARGAAVMVAVGAAALSFAATSEVAESYGAVKAGFGWIVPLVVEAGVLTAAALAWVRSGEGLSARVETTVMVGLLALSVAVNVAHAQGTVLGRVIAAVPPIVLLVAVEGLLREQRRTARAGEALATSQEPVVSAVGQPTPVWPAPGQWPTTAAAAPATGTTPPATVELEPAVFGAAPDVEPSAPAVAGLPAVDQVAAIMEVPVCEPGDSAETRAEPVEKTGLRELPEEELRSGAELQAPPDGGDDLAARIRETALSGETVTGGTVAAWLGVSARTGSRRLKAILDSDAALRELVSAAG